MKNQMKKLIAFCLTALMAASALCGIPACKKAEEQPPQPVPLEEAGLEQNELDGQTCYIIPYHLLSVEAHGTCFVNAGCGLTDTAAYAAAEALLANAGEDETAAVHKLIWANDEHIYLFCTRAMKDFEDVSDDDRVVLALVNSGDGWQTEELLPYPQSLSLFQRIVEETQPLRELTDEELQEAAKLGYNKAYRVQNYGESSSELPLSYFDSESEGAITSVEPIYSGKSAKIYHSPERSDQVLAELLMRRTSEDESFSIVDHPAVLFITMPGAWFFVPTIEETSPNHHSISISQPLWVYLITRDPETGKLTGELLENWAATWYESGKQG